MQLCDGKKDILRRNSNDAWRTDKRPPAKYCHHRPRWPRQDHPGGCHVPTKRSVQGRPGDWRTADGHPGPGKRARYHYCGQKLLGPLEWCQDQYHRHARPRGFRRRSGARPVHGGWGDSAGGCFGRPFAPNPVRSKKGPGSRPQDCRGYK